MVPTHAANLEGANKFITFMLRPENALQNARFTRFNPANSEALAELNRSTTSRPVVSSAAVPLFGTIEPPAEVEPLLDESWDAFAKGAPLDH